MFGRRSPLSLLERVRHLFVPRGGWGRFVSYALHRLKRLPGTPSRIAAGFACGAAVSFTPFIGFHFLLGAMAAAALRGNILASAIGTAVGNPWTFPLIWLWTYKIGVWILGSEASELPAGFSFNYIFDNPLAVLWPMLIGSLPTGLLAWIMTFLSTRLLIDQYQARRRRRLERRKARRAAQGLTPGDGKRGWRAMRSRIRQ